MNETQRAFLEQLAMRIPALFEAISRGNVKSEYIIGVRRLGKRQVRLKLVAEVVEPGQQSPLHTHSVLKPVDVGEHVNDTSATPQSRNDQWYEDATITAPLTPGDSPNKRPSRHAGGEQQASASTETSTRASARRSPRKR